MRSRASRRTWRSRTRTAPPASARCSKTGQYVFAYGVFYPSADGTRFEVKSLVFPGEKPGHYRHEEPDWWIKQVRSIADCYLRWQFGYPEKPIDFREYRTFLHLGGTKRGDYLQETDTISRLVYGFATAYLLTGEDRFLEAAEKGTAVPARPHALRTTPTRSVVYWYHGIDRSTATREQKMLASEFGDDYDAIPAYEQIYALAGPTQTYRVTGDPRILERHRADDRAVRPVLPRPRAGRLLLAHRPDHVRPARASRSARTGRARTGTRSATTRRRT